MTLEKRFKKESEGCCGGELCFSDSKHDKIILDFLKKEIEREKETQKQELIEEAKKRAAKYFSNNETTAADLVNTTVMAITGEIDQMK